jgi:DNA-binding CsgD family transcriptional regulator/tetratricopeptide (TPR) repeat protein
MKRFILILGLCCFSGTLAANNVYKWKPVNSQFDLLVNWIEQNYPHDISNSKVKIVIQKLYKIADNSGNPILVSRAMYWNARSIALINPDSASILLNKAIRLTDTIKFHYDYARIKCIQATILEEKGNAPEAYQIYSNLISYFKQLGDDIYTANVFVRMGLILEKLEEYSESLIFLQKGNYYYQKADMNASAIKNQLNVSNALYHLGKPTEAVHILESLVNNSVCRQDTSFRINVMLSLCSYTSDLKKFKKYSKQTYLLAILFNNQSLLTRALINQGTAFFNVNELDSAMFYNIQARDIAFKQNDIAALRIILGNITQIYANLKQWNSAYHYSNLFHLYNDSVVGTNKVVAINKIQQREEIQRYEFLIQKAKLQKKIWALIIFALCCISASLLIIIRIQRKKSRAEQQLKKAETRELNQRLKNEILQKKHFQTEIDFKNRELASNTLISSRTNQVLEGLFKQIEELGKEGVLPHKQEVILKNQIKDHLHSEDYWEDFKLHFEKVHPDFFRKLKEKYSTISENELRLCAYMRIGMTSKQIAQILSVLPESVHTSRYRLRKKIGLETDESIEDYLRNL